MFELKFADVGEGIHEGTVLKIHFKVGDKVKEGDVLVTVETDKVNAELPAPKTGIITKIGVKEGETVHVGDMVATISENENEIKTETESSQKTSNIKKDDSSGVVGNLEDSSETIAPSNENCSFVKESNSNHKKVLATPLVRSMAKKLGINLNNVKGTGINGKILKEDVEKYNKTKSDNTEIDKDLKINTKEEKIKKFNFDSESSSNEIVKISRLRKSISNQMILSKNIVTDTTLMDEVNISDLVFMRKKIKEKAEAQGIKLTYMSFIMKAAIIALREFPIFNASFNDEKDEIIIKKNINLGIAVDTKDGLIVPNIKNAQNLNVFHLAEELQQIAKESKDRTVSIDKLKNGTFTITNFGAIGIEYGTPIINYPELAILGIGKITKKPLVDNDKVIVADVLPLSLTIDHRIIDGADGGRFLNRIKEILNNPYLFLSS